MDFLTHLLIPYLLGKVLKRDDEEVAALVLGGMAPDLDFLVLWINHFLPTTFLIVHRGITHSLIFGFFTGMALLYIASRSGLKFEIEKRFKVRPSINGRTIIFLGAGVVIHLSLDFLTTRGVPLFYPLDATRWSAELFFYSELPLILLNLAILAYLVRKHAEPPYTRILAVLLFVIIVVGGVRGLEKCSAEEFLGVGDSYPNPNLFHWSVLDEDGDNITVYFYDGISRTAVQRGSFRKFEASSGEGLEEALMAAEMLPEVRTFRWRSYSVAITADFREGGWDLEFFDPLMKVRAEDAPLWIRGGMRRFVSTMVRVEGGNASIY